ncbi:hypothetical protein GTP46_28890 [Duganella sp. FT135W]|uniref:Uncharacterized protein n=1 Tax=Duganella flavida TaxID=2692175 RepID=A0A6L8KLF0_9BURK|nr:hypothetical protein [Duganella flavida]MYM26642.1 hypothetical protein [Duganella flavida]
MIVALTGMDGDSAVADLAEDLAMLRVAAGKRVLLVAPNPGAYDAQLYDDLVVNASPQGAPKADAALARAGVILALLQPESLEQAEACTMLLARLRLAQRTNPGSRVLVTVAHGRRPLTAHQTGCLLVFVAQLPHARLADTLVLDDSDSATTYHSRHSELALPAHKQDRKLCAPEVRHLYREIFRPAGRI